MMNKRKQIYHAEILNINDSDQNYLKNPHGLYGKLKGILLADRGFSNNDIFNQKKQICRLISPYKSNQKETLTKKEMELYKRRWSIESLFKSLKDNYSDNKLNLTRKYTDKLKQAKFYSTLIIHNLSTL